MRQAVATPEYKVEGVVWFSTDCFHRFGGHSAVGLAGKCRLDDTKCHTPFGDVCNKRDTKHWQMTEISTKRHPPMMSVLSVLLSACCDRSQQFDRLSGRVPTGSPNRA